MDLIYICAIICTLLWLYNAVCKFNPLANLPGPKGIPVFGNLFQIKIEGTYLQLTAWAHKYGDVYGLNLAGKKIVVVSSRETLYEVLVKRGKDFSGRENSSFRIRESFLNGHLVALGDPSSAWQKQKKLLMHHLKTFGSGMKEFERKVGDEVFKFVSNLKRKCDDGHSIIQLDGEIDKTIMKISHLLLFGSKISEEDMQGIQRYMRLSMQIIDIGLVGQTLDILPFLRYFQHPTWKLMVELKIHIKDLYCLWKSRVKQGTYNNNTDSSNPNLLYTILAIFEGDNKAGFDEDHCKGLILDAFASSILTSSPTLRILFATLVHNPPIQKALYEECTTYLGERSVTVEDRSNMSYHYATLLEVTRMFPVSPILIPHTATCDSSISGYTIPKGTVIFTNVWSLMHDDKLWEEPLCFNPNRFLDEDGHLVPADHPVRVNHLAFGAGPRVCPGETAAMTRMFMVLATMVQHFEILPATTLEDQPPCDCESMVYDGFGITPRPFSVRLKPRK